MNLFGQNKPPRRGRGQHGPPRSGDDRLKRAQAKAIEMALKQNPDIAQEIARKELGLGPSEGPADPVEQFFAMFGRFKELVPEVRELEEPPSQTQQLIAGLVQGLGGLLVAMQGGGANLPGLPPPAAPPSVPAPPAPIQHAPAPPPPAAPPAPVEVEQAAAVEEPAPAPPPRPATGPASLQTLGAIAVLRRKNAAECAQILAGHAMKDPTTLLFIETMCALPEEEVAPALDRWATVGPDQAAMAAYLKEDRAKSLEMLGHLRGWLAHRTAPGAI